MPLLALQLRSRLVSDLLGHRDSEIMDGGWIGRGDAGAVGVVVAGRQGAHPAAVPAGAHGAIRGVVPGRFARARAAQDGLDAGGGGPLLGPERRKTGWMRAEAAGDPGPWRQQALL